MTKKKTALIPCIKITRPWKKGTRGTIATLAQNTQNAPTAPGMTVGSRPRRRIAYTPSVAGTAPACRVGQRSARMILANPMDAGYPERVAATTPRFRFRFQKSNPERLCTVYGGGLPRLGRSPVLQGDRNRRGATGAATVVCKQCVFNVYLCSSNDCPLQTYRDNNDIAVHVFCVLTAAVVWTASRPSENTPLKNRERYRDVHLDDCIHTHV